MFLFKDADNTFYLWLYERKEMFYLMTHSIHFIYHYMEGFNNSLNTFYLRLYGIGHMVKDHSDSEKGNLCHHIGYFFWLAARVLLYEPSHRPDSTYHALLLDERKIDQ